MRYCTNEGGSDLTKLCDTCGAAYYLLGGQRILIKKSVSLMLWRGLCGPGHPSPSVAPRSRQYGFTCVPALLTYLHQCRLYLLTHSHQSTPPRLDTSILRPSKPPGSEDCIQWQYIYVSGFAATVCYKRPFSCLKGEGSRLLYHSRPTAVWHTWYLSFWWHQHHFQLTGKF